MKIKESNFSPKSSIWHLSAPEITEMRKTCFLSCKDILKSMAWESGIEPKMLFLVYQLLENYASSIKEKGVLIRRILFYTGNQTLPSSMQFKSFCEKSEPIYIYNIYKRTSET